MHRGVWGCLSHISKAYLITSCNIYPIESTTPALVGSGNDRLAECCISRLAFCTGELITGDVRACKSQERNTNIRRGAGWRTRGLTYWPASQCIRTGEGVTSSRQPPLLPRRGAVWGLFKEVQHLVLVVSVP